MRTIGRSIVAALALAAGVPAAADAQVRTTVVLDRDGLRYFHLAVGEYYRTPHTVVARIHAAHIHPEEVAVVLFIAREARVEPWRVVRLRERGWSWWDISMRLGVRRHAFAALLPRRLGPPYGRAHGYWSRRDANRIRRLSDREIVDRVNLHFLAAHYRVAPERIVYLRETGVSFLEVEMELSGRRRAAVRRPPVTAPSRVRPRIRDRPVADRPDRGARMKEDPRRGRNERRRGRPGGRP